MRPNDYDRRQMQAMKRELLEAVQQVRFMEQEGRSLKDMEMRCWFVARAARNAVRMAVNAEKRFAGGQS